MDKATPTPSPASVDSFKFNKAVDPMPGHELCGDYARALLAAQPSGTNLAQECAKARRHGFLDALSSGTARELCALLRRGVNQLEAWHAKYGEHQPQWLPPAGDVRWMEDVAAALDGRAEVERLAAQAAPTEPVVTKDQRELIAKLRYMGKQYAAGQFARGGVPQKHYLEEAADEIEMMAWALNMNEKTPGSAQENADLRNVIQAACIDGIPGLERAWAKYFPGKPITVSPGAVAQSAPLAQQAREYPPLPEGKAAIRCVADTEEGGWIVDFDCEGPLSHDPEEGELLFTADQMRAYVDADRAAAQVEPPSMPSSEWLAEALELEVDVYSKTNDLMAEPAESLRVTRMAATVSKARQRLRAHLSKRVTAPQLKHAGWFQELPSGMSYRLWEQGGHEAQPGDVELFERVIPADGEVRG